MNALIKSIYEWNEQVDKKRELWLTQRERAYLPTVLLAEEMKLANCMGQVDQHLWLITLTDLRLIFLHVAKSGATKLSSIELEKITSISAKPGFFHGALTIVHQHNMATAAATQKIRVSFSGVPSFVKKAAIAIEQRQRASPGTNTPGEAKSPTLSLPPLKHSGLFLARGFGASGNDKKPPNP